MVSLPTTIADDVAVAPGEIDGATSISRSLRSAFLSIQAPTVTFRPNSAAIGGTSSLPPVEEYSRIARVSGGELLQIGANFLGVGDVVGDGVTRFERRIGNARQDTPEVGRLLLLLEHTPKRSVSGGHKQQNGDDGAHRD